MKPMDIYKYLIDHLCQMYGYNLRGDTLEIYTNHTTVNNKIVSVFVRENNGNFIVSDGGWIDEGQYGYMPDDQETEITEYLWSYFIDTYKIEKLLHPDTGTVYYYRKSDKKHLAFVVFEMSEFIQSMINAMQLQYREKEVRDEKVKFTKKVNEYLKKQVKQENLQLLYRYNNTIRFNALIKTENNQYLINYVTGANSGYYNKNLADTAVKFQMLNGNPFNKIVVLNDETDGYVPHKSQRYIDFLSSEVGADIVKWTQKEQLSEILY